MTTQRERFLQLRVSEKEREGFRLAATIAGIPLSSWIRERLRQVAMRELESSGRKAPFVPEIPLENSDQKVPFVADIPLGGGN